MKIERTNSFTCNNLPDKERKNLLILDLVRNKGPLSRTEISKLTGINIVSVSNYISSYIEKGLIMETGLDVSTGGRKPELVELNSRANHVIGIDINGDRARVVIADLAIKAVNDFEAEMPGGGRPDLARCVIDITEEAMRRYSVQKETVRAIGIGADDPRVSDLNRAVTGHFGTETMTGQRALCAAYGEKRLNPEAQVENLLYMHSDLGTGIVITKELCVDSSCTTEFPIGAKYLRPWNRNLGVVNAARKEIARGVGTSIVSIVKARADDVSQDAVIEAAKGGDKLASDIMTMVALNLGLRVAYLINIFTPQAVVIGGGFEKGGNIVFEAIKKVVNKLSVRTAVSDVKVVASSLGESSAGLGAAALAAREMFLKV